MKNNPKSFLLKDDEKDYELIKSRILATYPPKDILKQFNIMKRLINQCSIPNILKVIVIHNFNRNKAEKIMTERKTFWGIHRLLRYLDSILLSSRLNFPRPNSSNNDLPSMKNLTMNTFYVNEFADMMKEIQEKEVFRSLIYGINIIF